MRGGWLKRKEKKKDENKRESNGTDGEIKYENTVEKLLNGGI